MIYIFNVFQCRERNGLQLVQPTDIRRVPEQYGERMQPVAACSSRFLEIRLRSVRHVHVNHEADIRLVNPHSESIGADHYPGFSALPVFLPLHPLLVTEAGMVE